MRSIYCIEHKREPTPPDDAARGLFERWTLGNARKSMMCDMCFATIEAGDPCHAVSVPGDSIRSWEEELLDL